LAKADFSKRQKCYKNVKNVTLQKATKSLEIAWEMPKSIEKTGANK